jgi:DtxR family Mn-dependent transcriptional regulator
VAEWHDTTEEYLEAILEIEEEGTVPIRARLVERLGLSAPAVSETVNRLVDHGYAELLDDRSLRLTDKGRQVATSIVRRHRLAERLLVDVIGLPWELVHAEACRWEHVMSEAVERRLLELLDHPTESPYGNPIPGLSELGAEAGEEFMDGVRPLAEVVRAGEQTRVRIRRISEEVQKDESLMSALRRIGALPDKDLVATEGPEGVLIGSGGETAEIDPDLASHVFVRAL